MMKLKSVVIYNVYKSQKHSYEVQKWDRYKTYKLFEVQISSVVPTFLGNLLDLVLQPN